LAVVVEQHQVSREHDAAVSRLTMATRRPVLVAQVLLEGAGSGSGVTAQLASRAGLPIGTAAFLITDVEAWTERWQRDEHGCPLPCMCMCTCTCTCTTRR
jgi:hypothetical protein